jgi:hypothetical protein
LSLKSKVEATDIFIFTGLILIGVGLFFWFGIGPALSVPGALLLAIGFFGGAIRGK